MQWIRIDDKIIDLDSFTYLAIIPKDYSPQTSEINKDYYRPPSRYPIRTPAHEPEVWPALEVYKPVVDTKLEIYHVIGCYKRGRLDSVDDKESLILLTGKLEDCYGFLDKIQKLSRAKEVESD